jgi:glycosyltransferase involved in cell wall biosynthesis
MRSIPGIKMLLNNRIAFIIYGYPLGVSSMVVNSIRLFARKGFPIDVYINSRNLKVSPVTFAEEKVNFIIFDDLKESNLLKCYRFIMRQTGNLFAFFGKTFSISFTLSLLFPHLFAFSKWLEGSLRHRDYKYILPVEFYSLICAENLATKGDVIYYNLELMDWAKKNPIVRNSLLFKYLEYRSIKTSVSYVAVPSPRRAQLFSRINDFDISKVHVLPVASTGEPVITKSSFFREAFSIPEDQVIVIYCGNIMPWAKCLEIVQSVRKWPKKYVLVMHTWNRPMIGTSYYRRLTEEARGLPVFFSKDYIEHDQLPVALSSADIGIAFYEELDDNFTEILYSSNKIGEYLKAGLPIVCSDLPSLRDFVEANGIGLTTSLTNLPSTIKLVGDNLAFYRKNIFPFYQSKYRFEHYFDEFCARLFNDIS